MITLDRSAARETPFTVEVDPSNPWSPPACEDAAVELVTFYLRPFDGHDSRAFSDMMMVVDKKGGQRFAAGTLLREKVKRGVVRVEGLELQDGARITRIDDSVYDLLPAWLINRVAAEINRRNAEDPEEEGN